MSVLPMSTMSTCHRRARSNYINHNCLCLFSTLPDVMWGDERLVCCRPSSIKDLQDGRAQKRAKKRWLLALSSQTSTYLTSYPPEDSSGASVQHHLPQQQCLPNGNRHPQSALLSLQTPPAPHHTPKPTTSAHILTGPADLHKWKMKGLHFLFVLYS